MKEAVCSRCVTECQGKQSVRCRLLGELHHLHPAMEYASRGVACMYPVCAWEWMDQGLRTASPLNSIDPCQPPRLGITPGNRKTRLVDRETLTGFFKSSITYRWPRGYML